jgi:hypothetical protein
MPELSVSQASKEITHNQALAILDQVAQLTVISRLNTPPGSPANGDAYIVGTSPTGAWTGKANQVAYWLTAVNAWQFIVPANGWLAWSNADAKTYRLESSAWVELATGGGGATLPVVRAITANEALGLTSINTFGFNSTASNYTSTIPAQSTVAWTADAEMSFKAASTGTLTITAAAGVTLNGVVAGSLTLQAGAAGSIKRKSADVWEAVGAFGTAAQQRAALGVPSAFGMRNLFINGNFAINQRVYVSGAATSVANQYTLDRLRVVVSGQSITFSASGNGNQITAPAGGAEQVIEGVNIAGGTHVLNWVGTATATVNGVARTKGEAFTLPAATNATVRLIGGTASEVQLEAGSVVTAFEFRPLSLERSLCQAYYWKSFPDAVAPAQNSGAVTTAIKIVAQSVSAGGISVVYLPIQMRATPTITTFNPSAANANWRDITNNVDVTRFLDPSATSGKFGISHGSGATAGAVLSIHATAEAEL